MAKRVAKHVFCGCFVLRYDLSTSVLGVRSGGDKQKGGLSERHRYI